MNIEILDLGINNLKSLYKGMESTNVGEVKVIDAAEKSDSPDLLILPGVGSFGEAMHRVMLRSFDLLINNHLNSDKKIFGICLGMHLMFQESEESPGIPGLGVFEGKVMKLGRGERVPNVGWQEARYNSNARWDQVMIKNEYYFVHSYVARPKNTEDILAESMHGSEPFVSAVISENALGVQFHPEKSSGAGEEILDKVMSWVSTF